MVAVISASGTVQIKVGPGYLNGIDIAAAGTSWTLQVKDGPDSLGNYKTLIGSSAITVPVVGTNLVLSPMFFGNGLNFILSGATPGELDINFT